MCPVNLPAFGETNFFDNQENRESRVISSTGIKRLPMISQE